RAGTGTSGQGQQPRTAEAVAGDLQALIDKTPIETPFVLLSHSLGGMYAQLFAAQHPNEIAGLLFLDPRTAEFQLGYRDTLTPDTASPPPFTVSPPTPSSAFRVSAPPIPLSTSTPGPPVRTFAAALPVRESFPAPPTTFSVKTSSPSPTEPSSLLPTPS